MSYRDMTKEQLDARKAHFLHNRESTVLKLVREEAIELETRIKNFRAYHPELTKEANELLAQVPRVKMSGKASEVMALLEEYQTVLYVNKLIEFWRF